MLAASTQTKSLNMIPNLERGVYDEQEDLQAVVVSQIAAAEPGPQFKPWSCHSSTLSLAKALLPYLHGND